MAVELSSSELVDRLREKYALTPEEIEKHTATFDLYDRSGAGRVSLDELAHEVEQQAELFKDKSLGAGLRRIYIGRMQKFSKRGDNCLSYSEFVLCKQYGKVADAFRSLKYRGDYRGFVEAEEMKTYLLTRLRDQLNEEIIQHVLGTVERDRDGRVTFQDFMEGLVMFIAQTDSDFKRPPPTTSPDRSHLTDEGLLLRLRRMFRLSEEEQKHYIEHFKQNDQRNLGSVTFEQLLELDGAEDETAEQRERREARLRRLVELSPDKHDTSRFSLDDFLTLKKIGKVYACVNEHTEAESDYVLEKEALRKYVHKKIWLRGVNGRFLDELLDTMKVDEQVSIDEFAIALSLVLFPLGK